MIDEQDDDNEPDELNPRQIRFCKEYVIDLNGTLAYQRAGYETKTDDVAGSNAARLLTDDRVKKYIKHLKKVQSIRLGLTADDVIARLDHMSTVSPDGMFDDDGEILPIRDWPPEFKQAVNGIRMNDKQQIVDVKLVDKKGATELLGKHLKLFSEVQDVNINGNVKIIKIPAKTPLPDADGNRPEPEDSE